MRLLIRWSLLAVATVWPPIARAQPARAEVYTADVAHSILDFTVRLAGFNRTRGSFKDWNADFGYDPANPRRSSISFLAAVGSIETGIDERDTDLKGVSFFDVT